MLHSSLFSLISSEQTKLTEETYTNDEPQEQPTETGKNTATATNQDSIHQNTDQILSVLS